MQSSLDLDSRRWRRRTAKYAADHHETRVRRVLAVIRDASGSLRALDLTKEGIGEKIAAATNKDLMESLFASEAMAY